MQNLAIEYLQSTKNKFPEKTAIVDEGQGITFNQLWKNSLTLAYWINTEFQITNQPICVGLPKSIDAVIALLAIQMSGNIYVPLDIETPLPRRNKILEALGSDRVIEHKAGKFNLAGKIFSSTYEDLPQIDRKSVV